MKYIMARRPRRYRKRPLRRKGRGRKALMFRKKRVPTFAPEKMCVKLIDFQHGSLNPGVAGIPDADVFAINSIYDPARTGGDNSQPRGFDQWMSTGDDSTCGIYYRYTVIGARIRVTFRNQDASNMQQVGIAVRQSTVTGGPTDYTESRYCKSTILDVAGSGSGVKTLSFKISPKQIWGARNLLDGSAYQGTATADPNRLAYFHVWAQQPDGVDSGAVAVECKLEYIVVFTNPVDPVESL